MKRLLRGLTLLVLLVLAVAIYFTLRTPGHLYRYSGVFNDCPSRPSCVSSVARAAPHAIAPLRYEGDAVSAQAQLEALITATPGAEIAHREPGYVHAVYVSRVMRYRDDLELRLLPDGIIQVRSLSRFGYRDFDVNRERVEALRTAFDARRPRLPPAPDERDPEPEAAEEEALIDEDEVYEEEEVDEEELDVRD